MFKRYLLAGPFVAIGAFILCFATVGQAQKAQKNNASPNAPNAVAPQGIRAVAFAVTAPARTFPGAVVDSSTYDIELQQEKEINELNTARVRPAQPGPSSDGALRASARAQQGTKLSDVWNKAVPSPNAPQSSFNPIAGITFEGAAVNGSAPPDTNAAVGPNDIVETVNTLVQIFDKAGNPRLPAFRQSNFYKAMGGVCAVTDDGDPVVLYDRLADRWVITQFGFLDFNNGPYHECIAVSKTGDPTGEYYAYDLQLPGQEFPDYPKFGVWNNAYYMTTNQFFGGGPFDGVGVFAFDRTKMLVGDHSGFLGIYFNLDLASHPEGIFGMLPSDHSGLLPPPAGAPNVFIYFTNVLFGDPADGLRLFDFNFVPDPNIFSSTFTEVTSYASPLPLSAFDARDPNNRGDIEQPPPATNPVPDPVTGNPTGDRLDSIGSRLMYPLHYINRNGIESLVGNLTVNVTGVDPTSGAQFYQAGFRYFELRRFSPSSTSNYFVNEQSTLFINNAGISGTVGVNSWIASLAMDNQGNIAAGFTVSSATLFNPSLVAGGRAFDSPPNGFEGAFVLFGGTGVQRGTGNRWGDYSSLSLDPVDDCTFWHANEYYTSTNATFNWQTRIGAFKISQTCTPPSQGTLAGTITACNSGAPLSLAMVQISNGTSTTTTATSNGNYSIQLPPGDYTVNIIDPNRSCDAAGPFSVSVFDSQTTTLNACLTGVPLPTVDPSDPTLEVITGGNNNGIIDANECNMLTVTAKNIGCAPATSVKGVLSTSTAGVTITQPNANYLDMPIDGSSSNTTPFKVSTAPGFVCGTAIDFTLTLNFTGGSRSSSFSIPTCGETAPPQPFNGSLTAADLTQVGRLGRNGVPSSCAGKACPGHFITNPPGGPGQVAPHVYDKFNFVNGPVDACVTINVTNGTGTATNPILGKAYLNSYDPIGDPNMCTNYLGDAGGSSTNESFNVEVPANQTLVVVVEESGNGGTVPPFTRPTNYTGLVSGLSAVPVPGPGICKFDTKISTHAGPETHVQGTVFDQATLTTVVPGGPAATGTITFRLFGPNQSTCGGALVFMSTVAVNGDGTYTSASFTPTAPGTYRWIANYSGDSAHNPIAGMCNDANESELVQPPATQVHGSGTINSPFGGSASFIVNGQFGKGSRVVGNIDFNDPNAGFRMTQIKVTSMSFSGDCVVLQGTAKIGKTRVSFTVEACDFESPGTDFYLISISNGYFASGFITSGSIEFTP